MELDVAAFDCPGCGEEKSILTTNDSGLYTCGACSATFEYTIDEFFVETTLLHGG